MGKYKANPHLEYTRCQESVPACPPIFVFQADATSLFFMVRSMEKLSEFFSFFKIIPTFFDLLLPLNKTSVGWTWEILRRRVHGTSVGQERHFTV